MLWKPRHHVITPTCPKCGLLRSEYVRRNRRRLGVGWLHGTCNCCGTCPDGITISLSQVDENLCTNCKNTGLGSSREYTFLDMNGDYDTPSPTKNGGVCEYSVVASSTASDTSRWTQYDQSDCQGNTTNKNATGWRVDCNLDANSNEVLYVFASSFISGGLTTDEAHAFEFDEANHATQYFLGDSLPNDLACADLLVGSDGGTAVVTETPS